MSANTYEICCKHIGKNVRIDDCYGNVHYGRIMRVDRKQVYIMPSRRMFGLGIGYWGWGNPGAGFGYGIALGTILGVALIGAFGF